jgi:hypothetical protein
MDCVYIGIDCDINILHCNKIHNMYNCFNRYNSSNHKVSSASIWDSAPTTTSTLLLHFSASKFPRENHAVKIPKDAFSLVVDYYKDNVSKNLANFRKSLVSETLHAFQKTHCFVNCSEISEKVRGLRRGTGPDPTRDRARSRYLTILFFILFYYD